MSLSNLIRLGSRFPLLTLTILGLGVYLPYLGYNHLFDWDEINFAESAREMLASGNYFRVTINYEPFWEKPPLFFWLQALSMKVFGVNEFAARFPNVLSGIATLIALYLIGRREHGNRFGWIWSLLYLGTLLPQVYHRSGIIDPVFNLFIFLGLYFIYRSVVGERPSLRHASLAGLMTGLSILTKGPVGLLIVMLVAGVMWVAKFRLGRMGSFKQLLIFASVVILVSSLWYGYETWQNGPWFIVEFIRYQWGLFSRPVAGHAQPWYYHGVVLFFGCFPISILALKKFFAQPKVEFEHWMLVLFWVVVILFSAVTTKIVHYSSMAYIPLAYLAARQVNDLIASQKIPKWISIGYGFLGVFWMLLFLIVAFLLQHKAWLLDGVSDPFVKACLEMDVPISPAGYLPSLIMTVGVAVSIFLLTKRRFGAALSAHILTLALSISLFARHVLPVIERYSQGPAVEFFESHAQEDAYFTSIGYKSYVPYYYGKIGQHNVAASDKQELLDGEINKPVYFSVKKGREHLIDNSQNIHKMYEKGGYVFYRKMR